MDVKSKVSDFTKETTFHGLKYIFDGSTQFLRRIIWILCVVAAFMTFLYQVSQRMIVFSRHNTTVAQNLRYTDRVPFPAVTLCNINTFRLTATARSGWYDCIHEVFTTRGWNLSSSQSCRSRGESHNETLETMYYMSPQIDDLIYQCKWRGEACDLNEGFTPVWTDVGLCYTFNQGQEQLYSTETGTGQGLQLTLNIEMEEYMSGPQSGAGIMVLLHDPKETPQMRDLAYAVSPGTHTLLAVKYQQVINLGVPYDSCLQDVKPVATCMQECKKRRAEDACGCSDVMDTFNDNVTEIECDVMGTICVLKMYEQGNGTMSSCNCDAPCTRNIYDATVSYSLLDTLRLRDAISSYHKSEGLLPKHQEAIDMAAQVRVKEVAADDRWIDALLDETRNLREVTEEIIQSFNRENVTGIGTSESTGGSGDDNSSSSNNTDMGTEGFQRLFHHDVCGSLAVTVEEAMDAMYTKACRIEHRIAELPRLYDIDLLMLDMCGFYCINDNCSYGYPSLVLTEYRTCLVDPVRGNLKGQSVINQFVQDTCDGMLAGERISVETSELNVSSADCEVIEACAGKLVTGLYSRAKGNTGGNSSKILTLLDNFKKSYRLVIEEMHSQNIHKMADQNTTRVSDLGTEATNKCFSYLQDYTDLVGSIHNLYHLLSTSAAGGNKGVISRGIQDYLARAYKYKDVNSIVGDCYWFEQYLWWRKAPAPQCMQSLTLWKHTYAYPNDFSDIERLVKKINDEYCKENPIGTLKSGEIMEEYQQMYTTWDGVLCGRVIPGDELHFDIEARKPPAADAPMYDTVKVNSEPYFNFSLITDPSDPNFDPMPEVKCFSYPITSFSSLDQTIAQAQKNYMDPIKKSLIFQNKQPEGIRRLLEVYKQHNVTFQKSQISRTLLDDRMSRVPADMTYYTERANKNQGTTKMLFSGFYLYNAVYSLLEQTTKFELAGLREAELNKLSIIEYGRSLEKKSAEIERCVEDKYLCTVDLEDLDVQENSNYNSDGSEGKESSYSHVMMAPLRHLCYSTGDRFHAGAERFKAALGSYKQAFTELVQQMTKYHTRWKELSDHSFRDNFLTLDIYYKQIAVEEIVQQPSFEFLSLLSEVGGFLGLLLGASVLTVCEIFDFIIVTITTACTARKLEQRKRNQADSGSKSLTDDPEKMGNPVRF